MTEAKHSPMPCPFCGSDDILSCDTGVHWMSCCSCDADGPTQDTEADAIAKWNTRAATSLHHELVAALESVQKLISEGAMTGFNCHDGDWAERLFASQQVTSAAIKKAKQGDKQ